MRARYSPVCALERGEPSTGVRLAGLLADPPAVMLLRKCSFDALFQIYLLKQLHHGLCVGSNFFSIPRKLINIGFYNLELQVVAPPRSIHPILKRVPIAGYDYQSVRHKMPQLFKLKNSVD